MHSTPLVMHRSRKEGAIHDNTLLKEFSSCTRVPAGDNGLEVQVNRSADSRSTCE